MREMIQIIEHGTVRELRLARPPVNALSPELIAALAAALAAATTPLSGGVAPAATGMPGAPGAPGAPAVPTQPGALVLSGAPGMFSAGLDLPRLLGVDRAGIAELWHGFYALLRSLAASPVPIVAAITGHSPAGGAVLALYCDVRIMAAGDFRIGLNEVRVGLALPPVIFAAVRRQVGPRLAERLCASGALVTPEEALRMGLVDELAPPAQVIERAVAVAHDLAALPRAAMSETRRLARADLVALFDGIASAEVPALLDAWFSDEAQATMRAVVEKLTRKKP